MMTIGRHGRIGLLQGSILFALILISCSEQESRPPTPAKEIGREDTQARTGTPSIPNAKPSKSKISDDGPSQEPPCFVEIIYELDTKRQLENRPSGWRSMPSQLNGYMRRGRVGTASKALICAMGTLRPADPSSGYWIGYSVQNLTDHRFRDYQVVKPLKGRELKIDAGREPPPLHAAAAMGMFGLLRPSLSVTVFHDKKQGGIVIECEGKSHKVVPGKRIELATKKKSQRSEDWINEFLKNLKDMGVDEKTVRTEDLRNDLRAIARPEEPLTLYTRLSAIHHGAVPVAREDVLYQWKSARSKLLSGPYREAKDLLERVIAAVPEHRQALRLYDHVLTLEAAGSKPSRINGKLIFPDGMPSEKQKTVWRKFHAGIAAVAKPTAPRGTAMATAPVIDGGFAISLPSGKYRLTVAVPGYRVYQEDHHVEGETAVEVRLQSAK